MITSNGKKSTTDNDVVTLIDETRPMDGVLSVWTFDPASGPGKVIVNGGEIEVDAGEFSLQTAMYVGRLVVQIQRTEDGDDMTNWQAAFSTKSGT